MDFDALPLEIKFHILSFLTEDELRFKFAIICKKWGSLAEHPYLKTSLSVTKTNQPEIIELLNKYYRLRELKFTDIDNWLWIKEMPTIPLRKLTIYRGRFTSSDAILQLIARVPNIEELHVTITTRWHKCMTQIPACKLLKKLEFQICHFNYHERKSCTCADIFIDNCARLREIDAYDIIRPTKKQFLKIIKLFSTQLQKLVLGVYYFDDTTLHLLNKFPQLIYLSVKYAYFLRNVGLTSIQQLTKLQHLEIYGASHTDFIQFFNEASFPHLTVLFIHCDGLQDQTLQLVANNYPQLIQVGFGCSAHISDIGINAIIDNCCLVEKLHLSMLYSITGTSFVDIEIRLPNLILLNFLGCTKVKRVNIEQVMQKKPSIRVYGLFHAK